MGASEHRRKKPSFQIGLKSRRVFSTNSLPPPPPFPVPNKPYGFRGRKAPCLLTQQNTQLEVLIIMSSAHWTKGVFMHPALTLNW